MAKENAAEKRQKQQLVVVKDAIDTAQAKVEKIRGHIQSLMPKGANVTVDQLKIQIGLMMRNAPKLAQCSTVSVIGGIIMGAKLGLKFDVRGQAFLIPRNSRKTGGLEACFQLGYQGALALARRSGQVTRIEARIVYEGDDFGYRFGTSPGISHKPCKPESRGGLRAAYACGWLARSQQPSFEVLEAEDIARIKASAQGTDKADSPWKLWPDRMWKKSALIQLCKYLPSSEDLAEAIAIDEQGAIGNDQDLNRYLPPPAADEEDTEGLQGGDDVSADDLTGGPDEDPGEGEE